MKKSDIVLIIAVFALTALGIGALVEHTDIKFVYYIATIIAIIAGVPIAIPKIGGLVRHIRGRKNVASEKQ